MADKEDARDIISRSINKQGAGKQYVLMRFSYPHRNSGGSLKPRLVRPYCYGKGQKGEELLRAVEVDESTKRPTKSSDDKSYFKLFRLDRMVKPRETTTAFNPSSHREIWSKYDPADTSNDPDDDSGIKRDLLPIKKG